MTRRRVVVLGALGLGLMLVLLDWTVLAFDVLQIRELRDARLVRAAMVEIGRRDDGRPVLTHRPGQELGLRNGSFVLRTDAHGFRAVERAARVAPGARRIAFLGDGATLGYGVAAEATFTAQLELALDEAIGGIEAVNAGSMFFDVGDAALLGAHVAATLQPAVLVVVGPFAPLDADPAQRAVGSGTEPERSWWGAVLPSVEDVVRRAASNRRLPEGALAVPKAAALEAIIALAARCARDRIGLAVVDPSPDGWLATTLATTGIEVCRARPEGDPRALYVDGWHGYPSPHGHALFAAALRSQIDWASLLAPR